MLQKTARWPALLFVIILAVATTASAGVFPFALEPAMNEPASPEARFDPERAHIVRTAGAIVLPGQALLVHVDLLTHEITVDTVSLDEAGSVPLQGHELDPNCLSTQARSWVQVDQELNQNGPGDVGQTAVPGVTGTCRGWSWAGFDEHPVSLSFILAGRYGGSLDAVDDPSQSFLIVECDGPGLSYGDPSPPGPESVDCEYRHGGTPASDWTRWDSLMAIHGTTPAATAWGFAYGTFDTQLN